PAAREQLDAIVEQVDRLDLRIAHLLQFSRPAPFRPLREHVEVLVDGALAGFAELLHQRRIELAVHAAAALPDIQVDPMRHEHARPRYDGADLASQRRRRGRAPAGTEYRVSGSTVLIVDDEQSLARSAKAFLADHGYEAEVAGTGEQALDLLAALQPDVVFADVRLPGMSGLDLLKRIHAFDPVIPVVMLTAYGS